MPTTDVEIPISSLGVPNESLSIPCLRATFKRVLPNKYHRDEPGFGPNLEPLDHWRVAGDFDLLKFKSVPDLNSDAPDIVGPCEDGRQLLLFCLDEQDRIGLAPLLEVLEHPSADHSHERCPMLVLASFSLVPMVHQLSENSNSALRCLQALGRQVRKLVTTTECSPRTVLLGDLSGSDLLLLAAPQWPEEVQAVHRVVRYVQLFPLARLRENLELRPAESSLSSMALPGPACTAAPPIMAYRSGAAQHFDRQDFRDRESKCGISYEFRLAIDAGFEPVVREQLTSICKDAIQFDRPARTTTTEPPIDSGAPWDTHGLSGRFSHLHTFALAWSHCLFDPRWRVQYLIDSITVPVFQEAESRPGESNGRWVLTLSFQDRLRVIEERLTLFGEMLNRTQRAALARLNNMFRSSFLRPDFAARARDLYSVFHSLSELLEDVESWRIFLDSGDRYADGRTNAAWFADQFEVLVSNLSRALRARLEDRFPAVDTATLFLPGSGLSKTLSAYSTVATHCWQCLNMENAADRSSHLEQPIAACVGIGTEGCVTAEEPLDRYRRWRLKNRPDSSAVPKVVVLHVPQAMLLRPEIAVVHCAHEVAELSDWISASRCEKLRKCLNTWALREFLGQYRHQILNLALGSTEDDRQHRQEVEDALRHFVYYYILYCLAETSESFPSTADEVDAQYKSLCTSMTPPEFVDRLWFAANRAGTPEALSRFPEVFRPELLLNDKRWRKPELSRRPPWARLCGQVVASEAFQAATKALYEFIGESVADIGMIAVMDRLFDGEVGRDSALRETAIATAFSSMLKQAEDAYPTQQARSRAQMIVLQRWAIHAAAATPPGNDWTETVGRYLAPIRRAIALDDPIGYVVRNRQETSRFKQGSIAEWLRLFGPYGGPVPLVLTDGGIPSDVRSSFQRAFQYRTGNNRLQLILELWSLCGKIPKEGAFHPLETPSGYPRGAGLR